MKTINRIVVAALVSCLSAGILADDEDDQPPPSAPALLREVIARLPWEPIEAVGTLTVRRRRADIVNQHRFYMFLEWGQLNPKATYTVMDMNGERLAKTVMVRRGRELDMTFYAGDSVTATNTPSLTARVHGTDVTWLDLSLDFLWWPGAEYAGTDTHKGRDCYVVIVPAPPDLPNCAAAKIWIDQKLLAMLRAEQLNARGETVRSMWVHSLKKRDDRWMIKEMDIQSYPSDHRTRLKVIDVSTPPK